MNKNKKVNVSEFIFDDHNFNKGTKEGNSLIEKSIKEFGAGRSILLDKNNRIISGNKTIENAQKAGLDEAIIIESDGTKIIAVKRIDIDIDSKIGRELALADNATSSINLDWDIGEIKMMEAEFGISPEEWKIDMSEDFKCKSTSEDDYDEPNEIETDIKYGDLFEIKYDGITHRLHCGDSTLCDDIKRLMCGELADMIFTDPPYDLKDDYSNYIFSIAKDDSHIFIMNSDRLLVDNVINGIKWFRKFFAVDFRQARLVSNSQPMTRVDLVAEFCKGKTKFNNLYDGFSTLIECCKIHNNNENINFGHKQAKRVELPGTFISHYTNEGELVVDLFGGSGSTLVASIQLGRRCNIQEFKPTNCQIILNRLKKTFNDNLIINKI